MTEPFAWFRYQQGDRIYFDSKKWDDCQPLYTHPKEWVGLTISERDVCWRFSRTAEDAMEAVEAKLKEKNT